MKETESQSALVQYDSNISIVGWEGETDPAKPVNWSFTRRWAIVITTSLITFMVSFASSVFSATLNDIADEFDVSKNVVVLGVTFYVLGFAFGPLIWGPASELYGRTIPLWIGYFLFLIFQIPLAVASGIVTVLFSRFLAGVFGSAPLAIIGGMHVDFLRPMERGISTAVYSLGAFCGPVAGPIFGSLITEHMGWRWTAWITLIAGAGCGIICWICTPETSEPVLLRRKAQALRFQTGNWALHAKCEEQPAHIRAFLEKYLTKPVKMFVLEPILLIFTAYMSLVYGILYLTLTLYPFAFHETRGMTSTTATLPFIGLLIGIVLACVIIGWHSFYYVGRRQTAGITITPEHRLPLVVLGSVLLPAGLFWFAWTSHTSVHWLVQASSGILTGCGIILVFMSSNLFLIEVYLFHANSALAINQFVRSVTAAAFPSFSHTMFAALHVDWTASLLAFICIGLAPFPVIMILYGPKIRGWSKFAR